MSYDDVCVIAWKGYKAEQRGIEEKDLMNGRVAKDTMERKEASPRAAKLIGTVTKIRIQWEQRQR